MKPVYLVLALCGPLLLFALSGCMRESDNTFKHVGGSEEPFTPEDYTAMRQESL